jgi:hypothetical protein
METPEKIAESGKPALDQSQTPRAGIGRSVPIIGERRPIASAETLSVGIRRAQKALVSRFSGVFVSRGGLPHEKIKRRLYTNGHKGAPVSIIKHWPIE